MKKKKLPDTVLKLLIVGIWIFLWQLLDWKIDQDILFAGPLDVLRTFGTLVGQGEFWQTAAVSLGHIAAGVGLALCGGLILGIGSFSFPIVRMFLTPALTIARSVPVASFVVLALLWIGSERLSILISFLIAFPLIYEGVLSGLHQADEALLELCRVFSVGRWHKACSVYWYGLYPALQNACKNAMGMAWKAGVAAEVIGVPAHSFGEKLYYAKLYLETGELFAWTMVIMAVSVLGGAAVQKLLAAVNWLMCCFFGTSKTSPPPAPKDLRLDGVCKQYGERQILEQFSAFFPKGSVTAIMGPSGIGKTTLLRLIAGLENYREGSISAEGMRISMVFQEDRLLEPLTAEQNCRLTSGFEPRKTRRAQICSALEEILPGASGRQPVRVLSGGMRRRVAVARAMLAASDLVMLDEPFSGLDEESRRKTIAFIQKHRRGRTILFTTHHAEEAVMMNAEQTLVLASPQQSY